MALIREEPVREEDVYEAGFGGGCEEEPAGVDLDGGFGDGREEEEPIGEDALGGGRSLPLPSTRPGSGLVPSRG